MNKIVQNLLKVKSIITILTTVVFCVMLVCSIFIPTIVIPQEFMMIYTTIIAFYFGTQTGKADVAERLAKHNEQIQQILETDD